VQVVVLTVPAVATIFKVVPLPIENWALMGGMACYHSSLWNR
jgi:hypothetical protein